MKNFLLVSFVSLASLLNALPAAGQHGATSKEKKQPEVTFEIIREIVLDIQKKAMAARASGNELTELDAIRALEADYSAKGPAARHAIATMLLTLNPVVGNYRDALRYADVGHSEPPVEESIAKNELKDYRPAIAVDALVRAAESYQVVMINEAHHVPQHRAFTIELLKALKLKGFSYFASETLSESDTELNERGYPTAKTGYYTAEPVYGDLVRTALKLGYKVIAYEPKYENADQRERDQAKNLADRILKNDPKAKVLVHAGYSHIDEAGMTTGAITMAQRFKEMTGIDPLTIDQTAMSERSAPVHEKAVYRYAVRRGLVSRPVVFRNAQGEWWTAEKGTHDVTLFHPRSVYAQGRPTWLRLGGTRLPYRLPKDICQTAARCLVRARIASEGADAVPIDQLEIKRARQLPALMLPYGEFVVDVEDVEGKLIKTFKARLRKP